MPTLAELRAQTGPKPLPKASRTVTLIEGQHLLDEAQQLVEEYGDLALAASRTDEDGNPTGPPAKAGAGGEEARARTARMEEIREAQIAMVDRLAEFQAVIGLRGIEGGLWQQFKNENPPREDSREDERLAGGYCNASAVFENLGAYVVTWDGEDVAPDDWDKWLGERITYADRRQMVTAVVDMHEQGLNRAPKSPNSSSSMDSSATD